MNLENTFFFFFYGGVLMNLTRDDLHATSQEHHN
jgi:hypothetical protein